MDPALLPGVSWLLTLVPNPQLAKECRVTQGSSSELHKISVFSGILVTWLSEVRIKLRVLKNDGENVWEQLAGQEQSGPQH